MKWLFLSSAILAEVLGTLSLRASNGFKNKLWVIPLAICYGLTFWFLALTLNAGMPVGIAYGIWSAIGVALIALLARIIWKETANTAHDRRPSTNYGRCVPSRTRLTFTSP